MELQKTVNTVETGDFLVEFLWFITFSGVQRLEDAIWKLVLAFHHRLPGIEFISPGKSTYPLTHLAFL